MWIFAEDFAGCRFKGGFEITRLERIDYAELADCGIIWLHYPERKDIHIAFDTYEDAEAAYKAIKKKITYTEMQGQIDKMRGNQ